MLKIIKQHDERDCGAACIAMAAAHFGLKLSIAKCRKLTKTDRNGANLYGLADAAENVGLDAETLFGGIDELISGISSGETAFPFIAHVLTEDNMQHGANRYCCRRQIK